MHARARHVLAAAGIGALLAVLSPVPGARAQEPCRAVVVFTLPAVTWHDVAEFQPAALLDAVAGGAAGSVSVRTNASRTTHASGFATIGAGSRVDANQSQAQPAGSTIPAIEDIRADVTAAGYSTVRPGALGSALEDADVPVLAVGNSDMGLSPPSPAGNSSYALLAAMNREGTVDEAETEDSLLVEDPSAPFGVRSDMGGIAGAVGGVVERCGVAVVDAGDLIRVDRAATISGYSLEEQRGAALAAADGLLEEIASGLSEDDLLLIVSTTSWGWAEDVHFGVAVAVGPGYEPGATLESASTRRAGMVTLPDVAPTVLDFLGLERPTSMLGRPFASTPATGDPIATAVELDEESVFIDRMRTPISTGFVIVEVALYAIAVWVLARRERLGALGHAGRRTLEIAALAVAAFPLSTYLVGIIDGHSMGALAYVGLMLLVDAVLVAVTLGAIRQPLERLLAVTALTLGTLIVDLVIGAPLQLNTVLSYSPIVAGRFAGIGNIGYAVLAAASLLTATLVVHRWGRSPRVLAAIAALFVVTIVVDGAPQFGSDVGGALALVPGLGLSWVLLSGRRPGWRAVLLAAVATVAVLAAFLAVDLARAPEDQTHLARLFTDVRDEGGRVFADTITRKVRTNLRVFRSTIWTFVVPPALGLLAWLLFFPRGRWDRLKETHPSVRAGLLAGILLAVLGFAVNDSGIVIPAMMCSYIVPIAILVHLATQQPEGA